MPSVNRNADNYRNIFPLPSPPPFAIVSLFLPRPSSLCHPASFASACYFSLALVAAEKQRDDVESLSKTSTSPTAVPNEGDKDEAGERERRNTCISCYIYCFDILPDLRHTRINLPRESREKRKENREDVYVTKEIKKSSFFLSNLRKT